MDQLIIISCNITAIPQPEINWIYFRRSLGEFGVFDSSWVSTQYADKRAYSTLMYNFGELDLIQKCTTVISCIATNAYGTSRQCFTLDVKDCSSFFGTNSTNITPLTPNVYCYDTTVYNKGRANNSPFSIKGALLFYVLVAAIAQLL